MCFHDLFEGLKDELRWADTSKFYEARLRQPALAGHASPEAVVAALCDDPSNGIDEKNELTRALIEEHQRERGSLWSSMLLAAYYPMMCCLLRRLPKRILPQESLEQLVVQCFLESVLGFRVCKPELVCLRLRQATACRVFTALRKEQRFKQRHVAADLDELEEVASPFSFVEIDAELDGEEQLSGPKLAKALVAKAKLQVPPEDVEFALATTTHRGALKEFVASLEATNPEAAEEKFYTRQKRRRAQVLQQLEQVFSGMV